MSRSPENILLQLDRRGELEIREIFAELARQGFPTQNQTPHVSITFAPKLSETVAQRAAQVLPNVVPAQLQRVGTVVFGTKRKQTVAWLLETSDELESAARELSALNTLGRGPRWTPHLTMGLRLPREVVPEYLGALDQLGATASRELNAVRAVLWKPQVQELTVLSGNSV